MSLTVTLVLLMLAFVGGALVPLLALIAILREDEPTQDVTPSPVQRPLHRLRERILLRWDSTRRLR
ncbi:hypothetical protein [Sphingomonas solaris]|uniref:Uncharacterized protein n=1 Tax=Alterirhizorhabdus solaris TaxID=2529389 RepID=A0A558R7E3_9SPHN|nr:hypothetical protein [Sphingomonas solaris]TVV75294.1 hypothetical protein FOY91_07550 [Sphingomonas solaris]